MALKNIPLKEFNSDPEKYLNDTIIDAAYFKVETEHGTAVVIDEPEWNMLVEALNIVIHNHTGHIG